MTPPTYNSWGLVAPIGQTARRLAPDASLLPLEGLGTNGYLPYGNGRSYGDSCLNADGLLLDMRGLKRVLAFDVRDGILEAEAGLLLSDILEFIVPRGWFLPVTPGTRFVTLGGAVANDVHGKNHHARGTIGRFVEGFELWRSDGSTRWCSAKENADLYRATIAGMGLTGVMMRIKLRLIPIESPDIDQTITPFASLGEFGAMVDEKNAKFEYTVAWVDSTARGKNLGRGFLIAGNHAKSDGRRLTVPPAKGWLSVPFTPPIAAINRYSLKAFNTAYHAATRRSAGQRRVPYAPFFYPLDAVSHWNRLYGPRGLLQHQCIVPFKGGIETVTALFDACHKANAASFLTVLKTFGDAPSPGLLSFPRPGYTLTLDFPNQGERTHRLFDELDRIVTAAGGAVNPYKDARMAPETFGASFPNWTALDRLRDPLASSSFWRRVTNGASLASPPAAATAELQLT
ncbi:MAG: hypothetical protein RL291_1584 [Pseudomonadota bacterium]|jgi:FAD/FMN-containing dehydrogenase